MEAAVTEFWNHNLEVMSIYRSVLFELLQESMPSQSMEITDLETRETEKALSAVVRGKSYRFNSAYRPKQEALKWAEQFPFHNGAVVAVLFGLGNAVFAEALLDRLQDDGMLILYEPSLEIFVHVLQHYDLEKLLKEKRVAFCVKGINHLSLQDALIQNVAYSNINSEILCEHPGYKQAFIEEYYEYRRIIRICWERVHINKNTLEKFGKTVCQNTLLNWGILDNVNSIEDLKKTIPRDIPAIIVGAGPSLDKNIESLKKAKGHSVIIATDTAFKYLTAHEIIPDFWITIDPQKGAWHFKNELHNDVPVITKIEANPKYLEKSQARKFLFNCQPFLNYCFTKLEKPLLELGGGGSVATAAYAVCVELRLKTIILIGQDLAYGGDYTHAGSKINVGINQDDTGKIKVEGIDGNYIRTRGDWKNYLDWYEMTGRLIEESGELDITTIDATEGGAKIYGTKIMTLDDAIDQYCTETFDAAGAVESLPVSLDTNALCKLRELTDSAFANMKEMKERTEIILPDCERLISLCETSEVESYVGKELAQKIYKYNDWVGKQAIYTLLNDYITALTAEKMSDINQIDGNEMEQKKKIYTHNREVYHAIIEACESMIPIMEEKLIKTHS